MSVNVSYKNTVHSYGVSPAMLVQDLTEEISNKQNLHQFKLMLDQIELIDQCRVIKYLFTTFTLCFDDKEAAVEINGVTMGVAIVKLEDQEVFTEKATPEITVGQLKEMIARKVMATQGKWTLKKDGREIPDEDLVKTHLVKTFTVNMQDIQVTISITTDSGPCNYAITTRSDMTVLEFKRLCSKKIGEPVHRIGFVLNGGYLDMYEEVIVTPRKPSDAIPQSEIDEMKRVYETRTLESYQIVENSVILVVFNLNGGLNRFVNWMCHAV